MASSRASPASRESSPSSQFRLTPRSKVQALLASLDNDSDGESDSSSPGTRLVSAFMKRSDSKGVNSETHDEPMRNTSEHMSLGMPDRDSEDEDEEDQDFLRPKGRMVAKMLKADDNSEAARKGTGDDARERVKKILSATNKSPKQPTNSGDEKDSDEEEDAQIVLRNSRVNVSSGRSTISSPRNDSGSQRIKFSPTRRKSATPPDNTSDSEELPLNPISNDRFKALVEKKRNERLAKEAEAAAERRKKEGERKLHNAMFEEDEDISDDVERRLTQQARPTRKASKKALEEMHRETQRLSRNTQLAHNAITKKKITKASLFAKFNYKPVGFVETDTTEPSRPTSSGPPPHSDIEMHETPPTSPASHRSDVEKPVDAVSMPVTLADGEEQMQGILSTVLDPLNRLHSSPPRELDKGKRKDVKKPPSELEVPKEPVSRQRSVRIQPPKLTRKQVFNVDDSESDLEIVSAKTSDAKKKSLDLIFDRVPAKKAKESHSLHALRMLAHLTSPGKQNLGQNKKDSMTTTELQVSLQQRARKQAALAREERLQLLRDKGIILQSAEEREKEIAEVEDLITKARREGEEIMKREQAAAKKERKASGDTDLRDSSDDEDWVEEKDDFAEELSGSGSEGDVEDMSENDGADNSGEEEDEEEEVEEDEMASDGKTSTKATTLNPMFDNEADETEADETEADLSIGEEMAKMGDTDGEIIEEEDEERLPAQRKRRNRKVNVISDDDDEEEQSKETPSAPRTKSLPQPHTDSPAAPNSVLRSATKTFIPGLTVAGPAGLGLTQIFTGTMDEGQMEASPTTSNSELQNMYTEQDSLAFLRGLSVPPLPTFVPTMEDHSQDVIIDSQPGVSDAQVSQVMESQTQGIQLQFSQAQVHGFDSLVREPEATQFSEFPEPTQDAGFQHMTPIRGRFVDAPQSTIDTVVLLPTPVLEPLEEAHFLKKKGKLRRRAQVAAFSDEDEPADAAEVEAEEDDFNITANAFEVMRKASKIRDVVVDEFDKRNSKAKEMVHEQAEESEDEYAGLGGASDDESGGEDDAYVKDIIDDEGGKDVDERKLAAFFADRERANDEKQVEKLYNDITKGMLRRKRGADYDLSDSEDDGKARQRMKRKEFAKMRKALLADERIGSIAENPKRQAFLRAIEDRGSEDEMDFLDDFAERDEATDSQPQFQAEGSLQRVPDSQPTVVMGPPKRKRSEDGAVAESRPSPHLRHTKPSKKPATISEIRESLSGLIEEPNAMIDLVDSYSDTEDEPEIENKQDLGTRELKDKENRDPFALRRTNIPIIDRISLKRASSNTVCTSTRLAFASSSSIQGFKVPPLLRHASTNSQASTSSSTNSSVSSRVSVMERMAGGSVRDGIKRGGGKNSGVHYFARESERRAVVAKTEKRREKKRFKGAEVRRRAVGDLFGGGKFE